MQDIPRQRNQSNFAKNTYPPARYVLMTNILLLFLVWPCVGPTGIPTCKYVVYEIDLGLTKNHQFGIFWLVIAEF